MIKKLLLSLLVISSVSASEQVKFMFVDTKGNTQEIQKCFVDPVVRNCPPHKLPALMKNLVFRVVQLDNGEYMMRAHVKGLGGGPISAQVAYGAVWAGYAALCSTEGPVCAAHFTEFQAGANAAYWGLFFAPWCP